MSVSIKVKTLAKGERINFLDYTIKNSLNSDGLVLMKIKMGAAYECHLGNYGHGDEVSINNCKRAAIIYFMLARPEKFAMNMFYRAMGYGGQMHEFYLLRQALREENVEMPEEITCSVDMNAQIMFNNKPLIAK